MAICNSYRFDNTNLFLFSLRLESNCPKMKNITEFTEIPQNEIFRSCDFVTA